MGMCDALRELAEATEARRDRFTAGVRDSVRAAYAVGGATDVSVLRSEVHAHVADALELRLSPGLRAELSEIVSGMGAVPIQVGNQPLFAAVRLHSVPLAEARRRSVALKRRLRWGATGEGAEGAESWGASDFEAALAREGMPAEIAPIPRPRRSGSPGAIQADAASGKVYEMDHARFERPAMVSVGRVHRQPATWSRAAAVEAERAEVAELLEEVEQERAVLRLRFEGLSIRSIAVRLGLDRNHVDRALRRIRARRET
jgi:hypothetical protein